jgi:cell division protein FtsL
MNAAERLVHRDALPRQLVLSYVYAKKQVAMGLMVFAVMLSALGTIYTTETARLWQAAYQKNSVEQHHLQIERSQLLLERSAKMVPGRVARLAEDHLDMVLPSHQSLIIIHE